MKWSTNSWICSSVNVPFARSLCAYTSRNVEVRPRDLSLIHISTFGLFTNGFDKFDKAFESGTIDRVLTTNLIYQPAELLKREWYVNCDMSKYIAYLIDTLNHDTSISDLLDPNDKIQAAVAKYKKGHTIDNDD